MLALVMCLLVVGVAGVVLRDALHDGIAKPATDQPRTGRARHRRRPLRARDAHPYRSGAALVIFSVGMGLLLAAAAALAVGAIALAVQEAVDGG